MAATSKTNEKPTTKTAGAKADEVAKVPTGATDKGAEGDAPGQADGAGLIYTQADLDKAVADAVAAAGANQPQLDEVRGNVVAGIAAALAGKGDGETLDPAITTTVDALMAKARKEGFDAGKEEALEELAESQDGYGEGSTEAGDDFQSVVGRGIILGIILKMPANYRLGGELHKLNEVEAFLQSFEHGADRVVAVEIIKSLAESRPTELASPAYQAVVKRGLALVHGEAPETDPHADAANSPTAAFERMNQATGGGGTTFPAEAMPNTPPAHLKGEELDAFNRMQQAING